MSVRKTFPRRNLLGLASIPKIPREINLSRFTRFTVAHNAAIDPTTLAEAIKSSVNFVEVDLTLVHGKLVVAHTPQEYLRLPETVQSKQDPNIIIPKIVASGKKILWDIKDEVTSLEQLSTIENHLKNMPDSMASSNTHKLLKGLRDDGFHGAILYSIGTDLACSAFLAANHGRNLAENNSGVSIKHSLLRDSTSMLLAEMNALIAAWNPETSVDIANAARAGAQIITSGKLELLSQLGKPDPLTVPSVPQSHNQG